MEATVLSVAKSVLNGALDVAKSAAADEIALQLGVQRDLAFIKDEFEMVQTFLTAADEDQTQKKVVKTWVKQVRDLGYDVEDCLQDSGLHLKKQSRWRLLRTLQARHRIAKEIKELKARVEDVSQRNLRYRLIQDSSSNPIPTIAADQSSLNSSAILFGIGEASRAVKHDKPKVDLFQLISKADVDLSVITVWGTSGDLGITSVIREAYGNQEIQKKFGCRAWVKVMHPFRPNEFLLSLVTQFYENSLEVLDENMGQAETIIGINVLNKLETMAQGHLVEEFARHVSKKRYLIIIDGISTIVEWDRIKTYLPDKKNGSRIIMSTHKVEIASLCTNQPSQASELRKLSSDQTLYVFYKKDDSQPAALDSTRISLEAAKSSIVQSNEIQEDHSESTHGSSWTPPVHLNRDSNPAAAKNLPRSRTMAAILEEAQLIGREKEKDKVIELLLLSDQGSQHHQVVSLWGMGGIGKTTLVRSVYESPKLAAEFPKRAWVTVLHPFSLKVLITSLLSLALQLYEGINGKETSSFPELGGGIKQKLEKMSIGALFDEIRRLVEGKKYLIVLDDISSVAEFTWITENLPRNGNASRIIVTTREKDVASDISGGNKNMCKLEGLEDVDALELFRKKICKEANNFELKPDMVEEAKIIIKKCGRLPLAIATVGGLLATRPQNVTEWRKFSDHISAELDNNPSLEKIKKVLTSTYEGLPYPLKSCFLYLSIFPEDHNIRRTRLVRRWIAEGYSRDMRSKTIEEVGEEMFTDLINRSMIQPSKLVTGSSRKIDFCQVHDLMREISVSKSEEENLVFVLDGSSNLDPKEKTRHLVVKSGWGRNQENVVLESILDVSHIRSLTIFGVWRSFFISSKMRLLRVLDLEDTEGLQDRDLLPIGKLHHLKYLSIRRCTGIFHLPYSLGNLSYLETLDIRATRVRKLPSTITKLEMLKYLRTGYKSHDVGMDIYGVKAPRGIAKLRTLHTLGVVNVAGGKTILKDLQMLSQLLKLGVTGINIENSKQICSAISNNSHLKSLSMRAEGEPGLKGCLDDLNAPSLESLKLFGELANLPPWIGKLQNLAKLSLCSTRLDNDALQVLGMVPNLAILRLLDNTIDKGALHFHGDKFPSLLVLELVRLKHLCSVKFEAAAMPKLEHLQVGHCQSISEIVFSAEPFLLSLKEVSLEGNYSSELMKNLQRDLDKHQNSPSLKFEEQVSSYGGQPNLKLEEIVPRYFVGRPVNLVESDPNQKVEDEISANVPGYFVGRPRAASADVPDYFVGRPRAASADV